MNLQKQLENAKKNETLARKKRWEVERKMEEAEFDSFFNKWMGKWFSYNLVGDGCYGRVVGEEKEEGRRFLRVMEVGLNKEYGWVTLHEMPWSMDKFVGWNAKQLTAGETADVKKMLKDDLRINMAALGIPVLFGY